MGERIVRKLRNVLTNIGRSYGKNVNMEKIVTTAGIVLSNLKRKLVSTKNFVHIKNIVLLNILRKLARMKRTARLQVVDTNMKRKLVYLGKFVSMGKLVLTRL